jgi:hypothetical protein
MVKSTAPPAPANATSLQRTCPRIAFRAAQRTARMQPDRAHANNPRKCNQSARSALNRKQSAHRAAHRPRRQPARRASPPRTARTSHVLLKRTISLHVSPQENNQSSCISSREQILNHIIIFENQCVTFVLLEYHPQFPLSLGRTALPVCGGAG